MYETVTLRLSMVEAWATLKAIEAVHRHTGAIPPDLLAVYDRLLLIVQEEVEVCLR